MKAEQIINEDKLRNQRHPAERDTLMFVIHWLSLCSYSLNRKDIPVLNHLKRNCVKKQSLYNLNSYEGFHLPSQAQAKASGNKAPTLIPK